MLRARISLSPDAVRREKLLTPAKYTFPLHHAKANRHFFGGGGGSNVIFSRAIGHSAPTWCQDLKKKKKKKLSFVAAQNVKNSNRTNRERRFNGIGYFAHSDTPSIKRRRAKGSI